MNTKVFVSILFVIFWKIPENVSLDIQLKNDLFHLNFTKTGIQFTAYREDKVVLTGVMNDGVDVSDVRCINPLFCDFGNYSLSVDLLKDGLRFQWNTEDLKTNFTDCFNFDTFHWFGGPQVRYQYWPIEKVAVNGSKPYVLNSIFPSAERYWLNSEGAYIYLDEKVPLYAEQNMHIKDKVCFTAKLDGAYINRKRNILDYAVVVKEDPKLAHLDAVNKFLGKPTGYPNPAMIKEPIWITWAEHKSDISDEVILDVAQDIIDHGYTPGQMLINGNWETCYGSQEFNKSRFDGIVNTVKKLHEMNYRVTLWTHPFVNTDCDIAKEGIDNDYFVKNTEGKIEGSWWHGQHAYTIDFTNKNAVQWYTSRITQLQKDIGLDSFKFDGGETYYPPQPAVYKNVDQERVPNIYSEDYIRESAKFGDLIEVRVAYRTQDLPIFVRMLDKETDWSWNAGLPTLITTLLQLNLNGYTMILPDIIAGNGYDNTVTDGELLVRWTQANALMPSMQFSFPPWHYPGEDFDTAAIVKKYIDLHANFTPIIIEAMENCVKHGTPVNPPIWWVDPSDEKALVCDDEFLVGENILVAPVVQEKVRFRDIYLPKGKWVDGNNGSIYEGPVLIKDYPVPIELLPYFTLLQ